MPFRTEIVFYCSILSWDLESIIILYTLTSHTTKLISNLFSFKQEILYRNKSYTFLALFSNTVLVSLFDCSKLRTMVSIFMSPIVVTVVKQ
jgi:hypothetical protein